jgi:hypothetical protein
LALAALLLVATGPARAQELVVNGGFETGDFTGWTQSGNTGATGVDDSNPHSGRYAAYLGPVGSEGFLSQNLTTVAGGTYTLSYWLANDGGTPSSFRAIINGADLAGSGLTDPSGFAYTQYAFDFVATGTATSLSFGFRQDPHFFYLDDVSVVPASPAPEPASLTLFGLGLVPLAGYAAWRRRQKAAG